MTIFILTSQAAKKRPWFLDRQEINEKAKEKLLPGGKVKRDSDRISDFCYFLGGPKGRLQKEWLGVER